MQGVLERSRIERDVRKLEFCREQVPEDGPVNTQLPLHSLADAADLIAGDPFATGHAQCRNLPLHCVSLGIIVRQRLELDHRGGVQTGRRSPA